MHVDDGIATDQYQLCRELQPGHSGDVKAILAMRDDLVATASRDSSVGIWARNGGSEVILHFTSSMLSHQFSTS